MPDSTTDEYITGKEKHSIASYEMPLETLLVINELLWEGTETIKLIATVHSSDKSLKSITA